MAAVELQAPLTAGVRLREAAAEAGAGAHASGGQRVLPGRRFLGALGGAGGGMRPGARA